MMSGCLSFSFFCFCCYICLVVVALLHLNLSNQNFADALCIDNERQALLQFKHGLIDGADRLASWVGEDKDCCRWAGIVCDNFTGHVHNIHLPGLDGHCQIMDYYTKKEYEQASKHKLRGNLSPSLLHLKQLRHLDLSCNDFRGIQVPKFIGSLRNLRYLNISRSVFGGTIPQQLGNLTELRILCLGTFLDYGYKFEATNILNMEWLSSLHSLHYLDMSGADLSKALNWLQVINTLPSLAELHLSNCQVSNMHPHVPSNLTSLSLLDLSRNHLNSSFGLQWIFSISSLVSLDLGECRFHHPIPNYSLRNLTSLKFFHIPNNDFKNSSLLLDALSTGVGSNLVLLDISFRGISSSNLDSLHNMTSLLSLDLSGNQLTNTIPKLLGNLCNLKHVDLGHNSFHNISFTNLLKSFFECKSPSLESLSIESSGLSNHLPDQLGQLRNLKHLHIRNNGITGMIPNSIGQLSFLRSIDLDRNHISGPIPYSIGQLSSLELLVLSNNQLNGSLPISLGQLSKLNTIDISFNLFIGVVTDSHFAKLTKLKHLNGIGNNLTLRPHLANWIPPFQLQYMYLSSWVLGPQFPLWLQQQRDLIHLEISSTHISSTMSESFFTSFPDLKVLDMSQNHIQGRLFRIPTSIKVLDLSSNKFSGRLPRPFNRSSAIVVDLSNNSFSGSLRHLLCPYGGELLEILNLANNHLSGVVPECWVKWPRLYFLNLDNNNLSGEIPTSIGSLPYLQLLNMCNNKLSGRFPASIKSLKRLMILQLARNELVGTIPAWVGTELSSLRIINLRSNYFDGYITHELCHLTAIQILDLSHNNLSGNIPGCFNNFSVLSGKQITPGHKIMFTSFRDKELLGSASLVIKGREETYGTILGLLMVLDLSSNNLSGHIPSELTALEALRSLNLSGNQLTGRIPDKIGDMKLLESFDVSLNWLSGELPASLSSLNFLSSFNVSYNSLTGRVPLSTQLQGFNASSFTGNELCGDPLTKSCAVAVRDRDQEEEEENGSNGADWFLIISIVSGFIAGFLMVLIPLIVST